uniref:Uncharacterized protein n=1 Tax=Glossina brevipalpis TaxID=37001 RepID=A0A1A9WHH3_9MUSC
MTYIIGNELVVGISNALLQHYSQHQQSVEEAKKKVSNILDGHQSSFEEVDRYGNVGVGTVGFSGSNLASSGLTGSSDLMSSSGFDSSANSKFGASHSSNFATSSSFGSNAKYASTSSHGSSLGSFGSSGVGVSSDVQRIVPELAISGSGLGGHESYVRRDDLQVASPLVYTSPSVGSQRYYHQEERRVSNAATPLVYTAPSVGSEKLVHHTERRLQSQASAPVIQFAPSSSGSDNYVHQAEHRVQTQAVPVIQYSAAPAAIDTDRFVHLQESRVQSQAVPSVHYTAPSGGADRYVVVKEERLQQAPLPLVLGPSGGHESYVKYKKITTSATQPQILATPLSSSYVQQTSSSANTGSLAASNILGSSSANFDSNLGTVATPYNAPSSTFGSSAESSNALFKTGHSSSSNFDTSSGFGTGLSSANSDAGTFSSQSRFGSHFGSESNLNSKFGSSFGADSSLGGSSSLLASPNGLHNYMQEAERLAKLQVQGLKVGGTRTGGSQLGANLESTNAVGGIGGLNTFGGAGSGGYKTKSWEKSSKWSSQSELGPDGQVKNYKELSTGESEQYDVNGRRTGYKAATTTLDDNGKLSSYSLHT